jgi:hypothetical protein
LSFNQFSKNKATTELHVQFIAWKYPAEYIATFLQRHRPALVRVYTNELLWRTQKRD